MRRVLFVDGESAILEGLRRILRPQANDWETGLRSAARPAQIYC
jgi:hypothetical protein